MDTYLLKHTRAVTETGILDCDMLIKGGKIAAMAPDLEVCAPAWDLNRAFVLPGFIDIHTHGAKGVDINNASPQDIVRLAGQYAAYGVTSFLPTVACDSPEAMMSAVKNIVKASRLEGSGARILGIHLEGPFLSPEFKGSLPQRYLRLPDQVLFDSLLTASDGLLKLITLAPELPGSCELIRHAVKMGVRVSMGHSGASYEQAMDAISAGVLASTHTFNGMLLFHQHRPAIMGAALESGVYCEAICDGRHLHPGTVRLLLKVKGTDRVIAVTDSIMAAGMPDGAYRLGSQSLVVEGGDAWLADGSSRAGSTLTMIQALHNLLNFTGCTLRQASTMLSKNPAGLLGLEHRKGSLAPGMDADYLILDSSLDLAACAAEGKCLFKKTIGGD
ncbi:N-acetylglucosamine-6-phosphate deacetylase [Clostridium sp. AF18-27]|uniref:N-acetylglucosamine-6-phosphate deacetylase n=1 Tax=Enterocloster lavalensis TaxID=460384 RepID=UPI000E47CB12|nr:N-acetylglucosamine-6-phosphate deacetylase [Enterocloster lavalensis]RHR50025.1 N-acetylglucosamine-6-phosphate deacetylase [Clostridium sp. AF18-27]